MALFDHHGRKPENSGELPEDLRFLLATYRDGFGEPDAGPQFMPSLWREIESRQSAIYNFGRLARGFVTAASAICLIMTMLLLTPIGQRSPEYVSTYVEVLADHDDVAAGGLDGEMI